jgi:hypothetical protein
MGISTGGQSPKIISLQYTAKVENLGLLIPLMKARVEEYFHGLFVKVMMTREMQ